ncbi:hypothetical protein EKO04_000301 [Ascochyta lentis]|uniref:Uncharacterized protein n=1 Tax=Ascochyta lentis TaxID=205686 RepID=A0A8H7MLX2_9PLEO|nr:hypothetical protein EKO04_000301 [Ascochyta lentis]
MAPIHMQDEFIDDAKDDIPVAGLQGELSLKGRFLFRLGRLLDAELVVPETKGSQTVHIYIKPLVGSASRNTGYDKRLRDFTEDLQCTLVDLARATTGPEREQASRDQWDVILLYVSQNTEKTVGMLQQIFESYRDRFGALVLQTLGLDDVDEKGSSLDTELADLVIRLHQLARGYEGSIKAQNDLIEFAWNLPHRCPDLAVQLRCLLGSTFSTQLYRLVGDLGQPLRTHHTLIRAATSFDIFQTLKFHLGSPPVPSCRAVNSPRKNPPTRQQQSQPLQHHRIASPTHILNPSRKNIMDIIRPYLPKEDRMLGITRLQPEQKQAAALLIGSVLSGLPVPVGSEAYYQFGFVTCRNESEESTLSRYYRQFLDTTLHPTIVFKSIVKALEFGTLTGLLRNKGPQDMEKSFPSLQQFLNSRPEERPSIHRLVQFIRDNTNDEPMPCLRRDYGFKFCSQREHVTKLKALYTMILDRTEAIKLHNACQSGELREFAMAVLGYVDQPMRRLLQNDYPHPAIGFDNSMGLENYVKPLFKRTK